MEQLRQNIDDTNSDLNTSQPTSKIKKNNILMTKKKKTKTKIDDSLDNAVDALKYVCSKQANENEFVLFGKLVGTQLQKLPLQHALNVQNEIQNLLIKERLKAMSNKSNLQCPDYNSMSTNDISMSIDHTDHTEMLSESNEDIDYEYVNLECQEQEERPSNVTLFYNNWTN